MLNLARAYWSLIRGAKNWLALALGLFVLAVVAGVALGVTNPVLSEKLIEHPAGPQSGFPAFIFLLKGNLTCMLFTWCASPILGIAPLLITIREGLETGGVLVTRSAFYGVLSLSPHGLVEYPAILLCHAFFLRLGLRWLFQKNAAGRKRVFVADFQNSLKILLLGAGMFFVGAIIESFATPRIVAPYEREHLAGIGVRVAILEHQPAVTEVFRDSPAMKGGLASGLVIQKIDGVATVGKNLRQCRDMLHGRVGKQVRLEVIDTARNQTNSVELVRDLPKP